MAVAASSNGEGESVFPTRSGSGGVRSIVSYSTIGKKDTVRCGKSVMVVAVTNPSTPHSSFVLRNEDFKCRRNERELCLSLPTPAEASCVTVP